ncbi:unnamed protein product [Cuscuta europaea]|uniref:Uncharacterized protein n=1 Tax=Cuscuta europaea TaxID=41803 RepID=A0A9P0ZXP3_CUSEU|nr:unnamed protein product [Cuscuta europaea]
MHACSKRHPQYLQLQLRGCLPSCVATAILDYPTATNFGGPFIVPISDAVGHCLQGAVMAMLGLERPFSSIELKFHMPSLPSGIKNVFTEQPQFQFLFNFTCLLSLSLNKIIVLLNIQQLPWMHVNI